MKAVDVVLKQTGENQGTLDVVAVLDGFDGDFDATVSVCISFDNNMLVKTKLYTKSVIRIPEWMDPKEFIRDSVKWGFAWNRGLDPVLPESWQRKLINLDGSLQVAVSKLLKTKSFRSKFRESLRDQLVAWLDGKSDYERPFSPRQADALVSTYDVRGAKQADTDAYRSKRYKFGIPA